MSKMGPDDRRTAAGVGFALAAFGLWGVNPIYFKIMVAVPALEILAHRVVWTVVMLAGIITLAGSWPAIGRALRDRQTLILLGFSTLLISMNWFVYIWAIAAERVLETSLGYFINPLINVLLGVVILRERLSRGQALAVAIAALGVLNLALRADSIPWVALTLAFTFGFYGLIRKTVRIASVDGLFVETAVMLPLALGYLLWLAHTGVGLFATSDLSTDLLLLAAGLVTATPLLLFTSAARRLRLATMGMFQYIAPSCHFLLAVFVWNEPFGPVHLITFACIWLALAIFTADSLRSARRTSTTARPPGVAGQTAASSD